MEPNVDLIGINGGVGSVANSLISNGRLNVGAMRPFMAEDGKAYMSVYLGGPANQASSYKVMQVNAATLRRDEWKQLDDVVLEVSRQRLGGVQDLIDKNLTFNLGNAMGTTVLEWHDISDAFEADLTMDGISRAKNDRVVYQHNYLPIPIIHVDYQINARTLEASRSMGNPLDTTSVERATRKVQEKLEKMLFTNTSYSFGEKDSRNNNSIYSYVNHPDRNITTFTYGHWDDLENSTNDSIGEKIVNDVVKMKKISMAAFHYGPWMLYIPSAYETILDKDYDSTAQTTIRERILKIGGITGIKTVDYLTADNVLLVQMTSDVVRLVRGLPIQNVEWDTEGKFVTNYKVMTIQVPQIRSDQNKKSGIVHMA